MQDFITKVENFDIYEDIRISYYLSENKFEGYLLQIELNCSEYHEMLTVTFNINYEKVQESLSFVFVDFYKKSTIKMPILNEGIKSIDIKSFYCTI